MEMKTIGIIQARMGSTRFPQKVTADIEGRPVLWHVINRFSRSKLVEKIALATTTKKDDDALVEIANAFPIDCFRGSEEDVLDRFYQCAKRYNPDVVVRVTADCPLLDPRLVDRIISFFLKGGYDIANFTLEWPEGFDTDVISFRALKRAWLEARRASEREHVTPYIWKHPELFKTARLGHRKDLSHIRLCIDEPKDIELIREIYKRAGRQIFFMEDILKLIEDDPDLLLINKGIMRNEGYLVSLRKKDKDVKSGLKEVYGRT